MTTVTKYAELDLCAIRVAKLTSAGAPLTGSANGYVSDGAVTIEVGVEVEKGQEKSQLNGCGALMATFKDPDKIKRSTLKMDVCQLDALLAEFLTGAESFLSSGEAVGSQFAAVGSEPPLVCFEAWAKAWDDDHQAVHALTSPGVTWVHWVFPATRWVQGAFKIEHDLQVQTLTADGAQNDSITANGPFDDWPSYVVNAGGVTRIGGWFYDDTIPTVGTSTIAVTSAAS